MEGSAHRPGQLDAKSPPPSQQQRLESVPAVSTDVLDVNKAATAAVRTLIPLSSEYWVAGRTHLAAVVGNFYLAPLVGGSKDLP
jgi:hypothetical protein